MELMYVCDRLIPLLWEVFVNIVLRGDYLFDSRGIFA